MCPRLAAELVPKRVPFSHQTSGSGYGFAHVGRCTFPVFIYVTLRLTRAGKKESRCECRKEGREEGKKERGNGKEKENVEQVQHVECRCQKQSSFKHPFEDAFQFVQHGSLPCLVFAWAASARTSWSSPASMVSSASWTRIAPCHL